VAENPQQSVRELKDLVVAYAKQETTEPLKGVGRYVGFGLLGALLIGTGVGFFAVGLLRAMQSNRGWAVHGNWSWVPYAIVIVLLVIVAALAYLAATKRNRKNKRSPQP
jgi:hypothetical protein